MNNISNNINKQSNSFETNPINYTQEEEENEEESENTEEIDENKEDKLYITKSIKTVFIDSKKYK